jgi:predicted RNA-binding Zn-ribbon protein involved in translation (DUF1610 family)
MNDPATTVPGRSSIGSSEIPIQEGEDYTCPNCGCEIRVRHAGDPSRAEARDPFTCWCGTPMQQERG